MEEDQPVTKEPTPPAATNRKQRRAAAATKKKSTHIDDGGIREAIVATAEAEAQRGGDQRENIVLSTGYKARIKPVASSLIEEVGGRIKDPDVPMWPNPKKGDALEPNPADPAYLKAMEDAARTRGRAAIDAMLMFGVELLEPIPDLDEWVPGLEYLQIPVNRDNPFDVRWNFLKYVAVGSDDLQLISRKAGIRDADVERYEELFRGAEGWAPDRPTQPEGTD